MADSCIRKNLESKSQNSHKIARDIMQICSGISSWEWTGLTCNSVARQTIRMHGKSKYISHFRNELKIPSHSRISLKFGNQIWKSRMQSHILKLNMPCIHFTIIYIFRSLFPPLSRWFHGRIQRSIWLCKREFNITCNIATSIL